MGRGVGPADGAGAVGCNLEDTDHHGGGILVDGAQQADRLRAVKQAGHAAGVDIVLNARVDVFLRRVGAPDEQLAEAVQRARLYAEAGADCVYPIGVADVGAITALVREARAPVNVLLRPGVPTISELAELGVARISAGSGIFRAAMKAARETAARLLAGDPEALSL